MSYFHIFLLWFIDLKLGHSYIHFVVSDTTSYWLACRPIRRQYAATLPAYHLRTVHSVRTQRTIGLCIVSHYRPQQWLLSVRSLGPLCLGTRLFLLCWMLSKRTDVCTAAQCCLTVTHFKLLWISYFSLTQKHFVNLEYLFAAELTDDVTDQRSRQEMTSVPVTSSSTSSNGLLSLCFSLAKLWCYLEYWEINCC